MGRFVILPMRLHFEELPEGPILTVPELLIALRGLALDAQPVTPPYTPPAPGKEECAAVFEKCKDLGLLIGKGGLFGNTLRIKPPMCINSADAEFIIGVLDQAFASV